MRLLALLFLLLAFLSFITGTLARFFDVQFIHHDPVTMLNVTQLCLLFSIALSLLSRGRTLPPRE